MLNPPKHWPKDKKGLFSRRALLLRGRDIQAFFYSISYITFEFYNSNFLIKCIKVRTTFFMLLTWILTVKLSPKRVSRISKVMFFKA